MERAERTGLGVAVLGHVIVFGLLSLGFLAAPKPVPPPPPPIDVTFADTVAVEAKAPQAIEAPAQSRAPEAGPPEDAPPPAPVKQPEPVVTPPAPQPKAAPPPKPAPKPAPKPVPQPKTVAAPEKPEKAKTPPKPAAAPPAPKAKAAPTKTAGTDASAAPRARPRGSLLGPDFLKGIADTPSKSKSVTPKAAAMSQAAAMSIGAAILRQVQPCADRQVTPGPGAERIRVTINLRINRDGSLVGRPTVSGLDGVDDGNRRYVDRVDDLAISTFVGCSPLRGLPPDLYDVPNGWSNFSLRYKLPG